MKRHTSLGALAALTASLLGFAAATPSVPIAYCASLNTGSTDANYSTFQSDGLCYNFCNDQGYALAVVQSNNCWCADDVPASGERVDTDECDTSCPGYPTDLCGGDDLYGYMKLDAAISGTQGSDSPTTSATSTSSSSSTVNSDTTATTSHTTKSTSTSTDAGTVYTSIQTVTSEGTVIIQTVTATATPKASSGGGLSKGAVAGIVIAILVVVAAFIAGAILYRRHRKNRQFQEEAPLNAATHRRGSSVGIMSKTGTVSSSGYGLAMEEDNTYGSPRRMSMKPMDPRLDPQQTFGLYRAASHDSLNTIRDDQDYSRRVHEPPRVLRCTNLGDLPDD